MVLFENGNVSGVRMNNLRVAVEPLIIQGAPGVTLLFDILDRGLGGSKMHLELLYRLGEGIGCMDPLLNPESDDPKQEQDQESCNGKQKFDQV